MQNVLVLTSPRRARALGPERAARAAAAAGIDAEPVWLERGVACELPCRADTGAARRRICATVRAALGRAPVDAAVVPARARRKRLLLADMDSTIIGQECIDELGALTGLGAKIAAITECAMRGELAFEDALRERVRLLKGLDAACIDRVIAERITVNEGGRTLVATMKRHGAMTVLVSGGFSQFTGHVAACVGFERQHANALDLEDGRFAGTVAEPILGRSAKLATLMRYCAELAIDPSEAIAVGDGANDLDMLAAAGMGVAYRAKPVVARAARISIRHADLAALLFLQGYRAEEFVE